MLVAKKKKQEKTMSKRRQHDSWEPSEYDWDDVRMCARKQPGEGQAPPAVTRGGARFGDNYVDAFLHDSNEEGSGNGVRGGSGVGVGGKGGGVNPTTGTGVKSLRPSFEVATGQPTAAVLGVTAGDALGPAAAARLLGSSQGSKQVQEDTPRRDAAHSSFMRNLLSSGHSVGGPVQLESSLTHS